MEKINIFDVIEKVKELINDKQISFNPSNYDNEDDIPKFTSFDEEYKVRYFYFKDDKIELWLYHNLEDIDNLDFDGVTINYKNRDDEYLEEYLEDGGFYNLLMDVYYEHPKSYEIGDFETDFLGLK